jgi:hypothetical protein
LPTALFNQHPIIKGLHSDILGSSRCEINWPAMQIVVESV